MVNLVISGCNGRMGRAVEALCREDGGVTVTAGFDPLGQGEQRPFPVFSSPALFSGEADVVVDFSHPSALATLLEMCQARHLPVVLATTGYDQAQLEAISEAARHIPVFRSANMSLGVNVLLDLVKKAAAVLGGDYDVEIVERHHHRKVDAPSGTALMLADAISEELAQPPQYVYDRHSRRAARSKEEIGIHSVRGGTIVGEHEILFAGHDETLSLTHTAMSKEIFATGAINAAIFLAKQQPGLYNMGDLV